MNAVIADCDINVLACLSGGGAGMCAFHFIPATGEVVRLTAKL